MPFLDEKLQLIHSGIHCTAEVTEANIKTSACLFAFYRQKYFFCLWPTTKRFPFSFQKCRMSREFCCLFIGSWKIVLVLSAHSGSLFEILVARGWIVGASGERAPVRQQPWLLIKIQSRLESQRVLPKMTYTGRPHPKGVPFSEVKYMRGWDFTCWSIWKGRECHFGW